MNEKQLVNVIVEAYIEVMGIDKWNSLAVEEQHDVIMTIVTDLVKTL